MTGHHCVDKGAVEGALNMIQKAVIHALAHRPATFARFSAAFKCCGWEGGATDFVSNPFDKNASDVPWVTSSCRTNAAAAPSRAFTMAPCSVVLSASVAPLAAGFAIMTFVQIFQITQIVGLLLVLFARFDRRV